MPENKPKLKVLDLFSGIRIGGFSLGLERTGGFETVAFCEIEEFPRKVLAKHWPDIPCHEDVRRLRGADVGTVDVICGGYPCQPFSTAGKRRGKEDDRHLWPEFSRLVDELRPTWVIGENVAGHISMGLDDVLSDLERKGYTCRPFVIPACAKGAHHRRDRTWVVAHSGHVLQPRELDDGRNQSAPSGSESGNKCEGRSADGERVWPEFSASASFLANTHEIGIVSSDGEKVRCEAAKEGGRTTLRSGGAQYVADTQRIRQSGSWESQQPQRSKTIGKGKADWPFYDGIGDIWAIEPNVGRVADGVPNRVDRLKSLGNAVVPQIPEMIGHAILHAEAAHV